MAILRNRRKLTVVSRKTPENTRKIQSQNILDPQMAHEYISHASEEINGRVTGELSKKFSQTESRILGALSKLGEFLLNPQVRTCSVALLGTSRSSDSENGEPSGDRSLNDTCPEVLFSFYHSGNLIGSELEETHHMLTGVQEGIPYRSPGNWLGKQKKASSTSQPQFSSENTPATIKAHQILLALQQLATNNNTANFNNNISRISMLPKSLTMTMPTFDGKSENIKLFGNLFQTSLKIHNELTEAEKINYLHPLVRVHALQTTFKNITSPNRENLGEILTVFRRKNVKPQSMTTAKHKFQRLVFNPANQKLIDFQDELQKLAKDASGVAAQAIIEQFTYAKKRLHLIT